MEEVRGRLDDAARAIETLQDAIAAGVLDRRGRDRAIVWLAYAFEALWPVAGYGNGAAGQPAATPEEIIDANRQAGLLTTEQASIARDMAADCRRIAAGPCAFTAAALAQRLPDYAATLEIWSANLHRRLYAK